MKNCSKTKKIIFGIVILTIISGIIILCTIGFNKSIEYSAGTRIEVYIEKGYDKQDIISIANESFNNISFSEVEKLGQVASIKVKDYSEEELNTYKNKIMEKYKIEKDKLNVQEILVPKTQIRSIILPYVLPIILVTILSLIYIFFRNIKSENTTRIVMKILLTLTIVLGLYFSLILIFRLPFGVYTMPIALAVYIITLLISVFKKCSNKEN